jgi:hypothetical protein
MQRFPRYCLIATAVLSMTVLAILLGQRLGNRAPASPSLDDWDIPKLADCLNRAGMKVQLRSPRKDGVLTLHNAYLTTTHKDWDELSRLSISSDPSAIQKWRGVVYCQRGGKNQARFHFLGEHPFVIGPFLFYGDAELLERIGAMLVPAAPPAAH